MALTEEQKQKIILDAVLRSEAAGKVPFSSGKKGLYHVI